MTNTLFLAKGATVLVVYPPKLKDIWGSLNVLMMEIAGAKHRLEWAAPESKFMDDSFFSTFGGCQSLKDSPKDIEGVKRDPLYLPSDHPGRMCNVQYWNDQSVVLDPAAIVQILTSAFGP